MLRRQTVKSGGREADEVVEKAKREAMTDWSD